MKHGSEFPFGTTGCAENLISSRFNRRGAAIDQSKSEFARRRIERGISPGHLRAARAALGSQPESTYLLGRKRRPSVRPLKMHKPVFVQLNMLDRVPAAGIADVNLAVR